MRETVEGALGAAALITALAVLVWLLFKDL